MSLPASRWNTFAITLLLSTLISAKAQNPLAILKLPVSAADAVEHYGPDPLQFGELRLPKTSQPVPVVLLVHGGCWADHFEGYDPRITAHDLMGPLAAALTSAGVATWNIEYRRSGSPNWKWSATYLDIAAATDYLRKLAPKYHLDLTRVVVVGHSSGGQLALWLGARAKLAPSSEIYTSNPLALKELIDLDGPPDLAPAQPLESKYCPMPAISQFMQGTAAEQPQRYHDGSAGAFLPLGLPQTLVAAGLLEAVPSQAEDYQKAAQAKGDSVRLVALKGASHFDPLDPKTEYGKTLVRTILAAAGVSQ